MENVVKENNLKVRSYSFYESLYEKFLWIKPIKHKCFNKEYETHPCTSQNYICMKLSYNNYY